MIKYSKNKLLNNIDYLLKKRDVKIGELESAINVSPGYFSRLRNNESDETCPNIDTLSFISETLGVSLVSLLYCELSSMSETESFIIRSIEGIIDKTNNDVVKWEKMSPYSFINSSFPLCKKVDNIFNFPERKFVSSFSGDESNVSDDVYFFEYNNNMYYLIPLLDGVKKKYEFYMLLSNSLVKKICCADEKSKDGFLLIMRSLYETACESVKKIRIEDSVKNSLEDFLN